MNSFLSCEVCRRRCDTIAKRVGDVVIISTDDTGREVLKPLVSNWSFGHERNQVHTVGVVCNSCNELLQSYSSN